MFTIWNALEWRRTGQKSQEVGLHSFNFVTSVMTPIVSLEAAVVLDLHGLDASTQQVFATISPDVLMGNERQGESLSLDKPFYGRRVDQTIWLQSTPMRCMAHNQRLVMTPVDKWRGQRVLPARCL